MIVEDTLPTVGVHGHGELMIPYDWLAQLARETGGGGGGGGGGGRFAQQDSCEMFLAFKATLATAGWKL